MRTMTAWPFGGIAAAFFAMASPAAEAPPAVLAYPIFGQYFACSEHWVGNLKGLGDELGSDCIVKKFVEVGDRVFFQDHSGNGLKNEQWFGWHQEVLAPCTCTVEKISINSQTNVPGKLGKPPASYMVLRRSDGVRFLLAHVTDLRVKVDDEVRGGQVIALVGNNGMARIPHIHIGAWQGDQPLQIRFDLAAMGEILKDQDQ